MEPLVRTPVIRRRLPSRSMASGGERGCSAADDLDVHPQHHTTILVQDPPPLLDELGVVVDLPGPDDLALDVHAVADLYGELEDRVAHATERHDALGIELHHAHRKRLDEEAVGDPLAEAAAG